MKRFLFPAFLLLLSLSLQAQERYRWFHHIHATPDDVQAVCPESSGRVWFGTTRGLFRYGDCPEGVRYDLLPEVLQQGVNEIQPFGEGRMLVRTRDGGLWVYSPVDNSARNLSEFLPGWGLDFPVDWELMIRADAGNGFWISRLGRLYRKGPGDGPASFVLDLPGVIRSIDSDGRQVCVVTDSLLSLTSVNTPGEVRTFPHGLKFQRSGMWCALDGDENIWVGSRGVYRFPKETLQKETVSDNLSVMDLIRSRSGAILVATGISGIYTYSPDGTLFQHTTHRAFESGTLWSDNVRSIREGPDGALWVCYWKPSVSVSLPGSLASPSRHILPLLVEGLEENVSSVAQAPDGTVWFGTDGQGLFCRDRRDDSFHVPDISLAQPSVTSLFFDSRGRTWIGTYMGGIYCMEGGRVRHLLPSTSCFCFLEDSRGDIWAGMQGQGVYRISGNLAGEPVQVDMHGNVWLFGLVEMGSTIYAATSNGLVAIRPDTGEATRIKGTRSGAQDFQNDNFSALVKDSRNLLWLAGKKGDFPLEIFDSERDTILSLPQLSGQIVKSIVEDEDRNIWVAAEKDLIQIIVNFDTARQQYTFHPAVYQFRNQEPVESFNNGRVAIKLADGTLLFGGSAGYREVRPSDFPPRTALPPAPSFVVTTIRINNDYLWAVDLTSREGITLPHDRNDISLVISSEDYASPFETKLLYRIRNFDENWRVVRENIIDLDRLVPGHYDIEIGNGNPDGSLAGTPVPFSIDIKHPWYATWWAYLLYFLMGGAIVSLLAYYYIDRRRKKESLERIRQEADRQHQLNEMKLRFFTNISHDFRTPLSLIITPLETYLNDESHKAEEPFFRPIYRNAVRLLNLVNQILDFRKLEADGVRLNLTYGNLVPFLKDICTSFALFADEKSIRLDFEPQQEEILTSFDKDKLSKTVMNLLSNAFKFTPEEGRISLRVFSDGGDAVINIADTGPGIPDSQKKAIFARFYQYQGEDAPYIGSGIGLHIVKEFVDLHGGSVSVTDNMPKGSVFTVRIPLRGKEEASAGDVPAEPEAGEAAPVTTEGKRILLVEDNADFRHFVSGQLSERFKVFTATDGRSALSVLEKEDIDLIISDIMMEGMDGLELCKAVKTNLSTSHIPFILLTAKALAEDEIRGLELGADDYVTKPFHMQILLLRVQKLLDAQQQARRRFREKVDVSPSEITITSLDEQFLTKAIRLTEENMEDPDFSVEKLSSLIGIHRAHLYKKLLSLTGKTPLEFIRVIRLKRAAQYLLQSQLYVSEIAYRVGFNSPKLFTRHFKEEFGLTPREYQRQHGVGTLPEEED